MDQSLGNEHAVEGMVLAAGKLGEMSGAEWEHRPDVRDAVFSAARAYTWMAISPVVQTDLLLAEGEAGRQAENRLVSSGYETKIQLVRLSE